MQKVFQLWTKSELKIKGEKNLEMSDAIIFTFDLRDAEGWFLGKKTDAAKVGAQRLGGY